MMPQFAALNPYGVPQLISTRWADGMVEVPEGIDPSTHMCPTGAWEPRPAVEVRGFEASVVLTNIPPGTRLEVVDLEIGAIIVDQMLEGDDTLTFPEAGQYQIEVEPPMPWLGWRGVLSC